MLFGRAFVYFFAFHGQNVENEDHFSNLVQVLNWGPFRNHCQSPKLYSLSLERNHKKQPLSKTDLALHWSFSFFSTKGQMLWSWGSLQIRGICLLTYKSYQIFLITCTDLLMLLVCWQGILEPRWCSDCLPALCCCPPDFSQWELTSSPADPPSTNQRQVHGQVMQEEPMRRWERTAAGGLSWH